jgi:hypothetical protein
LFDPVAFTAADIEYAIDVRQGAMRRYLFRYPYGSRGRNNGRTKMTETFFMVCRLLAVIGVGTIITILAGIALGKIEV